MKRLILTLTLALMCAPAMWGACAATGSGTLNWSSSATWAGCIGSVPSASDATTIGTGIAVTCDQAACDVLTLTTAGTGSLTVATGNTFTTHQSGSAGGVTLAGTGFLKCAAGSTCNIGSNTPTSNTVDIAVGNGTTFWIENGGAGSNAILNLTGSITCASGSPGAACRLDGTTNCTPNGAAVYQKIQVQGGTLNTSYVEMVGVSTNHAVFNGAANAGNTGGLCYLTNNAGNSGGFITNYADIHNFGDATNPSALTVTSASGYQLRIQNTWFDHSALGTFKADGNADQLLSNVAMTNAITSGGGNYFIVLQSATTTPCASCTRSIDHFGVWPLSNFTTGLLGISTYGIKVGSAVACGDASNAPGFFLFDSPFYDTATTTGNVTIRNSMGMRDQPNASSLGVAASDIYSGFNACNVVGNMHMANDHYFGGIAARAIGPNVYKYTITDAQGYVSGDYGDVVQPSGNAASFLNSLAVNQAGNALTTTGTGNPAGVTYKYNTLYNVYSAALGETNDTNVNLAELTGNLFIKPSVVNISTPGNCGIDFAGITERPTQFVTQSNPIWGHNVAWAMPNSGDAGAGSCTPSASSGFRLTSVALGTDTFVAFPATTRSTFSAVTATSGSGPTTAICATCNFLAGGEASVIVGDYVLVTSGAYPYGRITAVNSATSVTMDTIAGFTSGTVFAIRKSYRSDGLAYGDGAFGSTDKRMNPNFRNPSWDICSWYNSVPGTTPLTCANQSTDTVELLQIAHDMFCSFTGQTYDGSGPCTPITGLTVANMFEAAKWAFTPMNGAFSHAGDPADTDTVVGGVPSPGWVPAYPAAILSNN